MTISATPAAVNRAVGDTPNREMIRSVVKRLIELKCQLLPVPGGYKQPPPSGFADMSGMSEQDAVAHVEAGGNLAVGLAASRLAVADAEDALATDALLSAGYRPFVYPARSRYVGVLKPGIPDEPSSGKENTHAGGAHFWFRLPDGIDAHALNTAGIGIDLPNGGRMDLLGGRRYVVVPPSALELTYGAMYERGEAWDEELPLAPAWFYDLSATEQAPIPLAPAAGRLAPKAPREKVEQDARSIDLDNQIDEVPWDQWIAGDPRLTATGQIDTCGCSIYHWMGADHDKSATLHDGCEQGNGVHIWSGTMLAQLGLHHDHTSRLNLAKALHGGTIRERAAAVGIELGPEREGLPSFSDDLDRLADWCERAAQVGVTEMLAPVSGDGSGVRLVPIAVDATWWHSKQLEYRAHAREERSQVALRRRERGPRAGVAYVEPGSVVGTNALAPVIHMSTRIGSVQDSGLGRSAAGLTGVYSGTWLDSQHFPPLEYHVPGLVAEGCGIVAGPPKVGKSWLVLALALAVAGGGVALGCLPCQQRPVLYLALEDGHRRLQSRARLLLGPGIPIPAGFDYLLGIPEGANAVSVVTEWLKGNPSARPFVIVDTLGKTRGAGPGPGTNAYQQDYTAVGDLKKVIDDVPGAGMLIVHHTRKSEVGRGGQGTGDFVEALSGTFGLSGAADYAMVLSRKRGTEDGALALTGRDVIERTVAMTRDKSSGLWTLDGGSIEAAEQALYERAETVDLSPEQQKMRDVVIGRWRDSQLPTSPADAATALGCTPTKAAVYLSRLVDAGVLSKPARGLYEPLGESGAPG